MNNKRKDNFYVLAAGKLLNENSDAENKKLDKYLESKLEKETFDNLQDIHSSLPKTKALLQTSSEKSWERVNRSISIRIKDTTLSILKYAAVLIITFGLGLMAHEIWTTKPGLQTVEIDVPLGQMSNVTLYDGTKVWLNSGSKLTYTNEFGHNSRDVSLDGEGYFEVTRSTIPFRVQLANSRIKVLGTSFNARSFAEENLTEVTLIEGSVKMETNNGVEIATLVPSQQILLDENSNGVNVLNVNTEFYSSWIEGKIVFKEERMSDVILRLERWYNVKVEIKDSEIGELRFSGTILKYKPFDQIAKAFELLLPVKVEYSNKIDDKDLIIISKK